MSQTSKRGVKHTKHKDVKQIENQANKELDFKLSGQPINLAKRPEAGNGRASVRSMSVSGPAPRRPMSALPSYHHQPDSHHEKQPVRWTRPQSADQSFQSRKLAAKFPSCRPLVSESSQSSKDEEDHILHICQKTSADEPLTPSSQTDTDDAYKSETVCQPTTTITHSLPDDGQTTNRSIDSLSKYLIDASSIFKDLGATYPVPSLTEATWTEEELIRYCDEAERHTESAHSDDYGQSEESLGEKISFISQQHQSALVAGDMEPGVVTKPPLPVKRDLPIDSANRSESYLSAKLLEAERQTDLLLQQLANQDLQTDSSDLEEMVHLKTNRISKLYNLHNSRNSKIHPINDNDKSLLSLHLDKHFIESDWSKNEQSTQRTLVGDLPEVSSERHQNTWWNNANLSNNSNKQSECRNDNQSNKYLPIPSSTINSLHQQSSSSYTDNLVHKDGYGENSERSFGLDCLESDSFQYNSGNNKHRPQSLCCGDAQRETSQLYSHRSSSDSKANSGLGVQRSQSLFNLDSESHVPYGDRDLLQEKSVVWESSTSSYCSVNQKRKTRGIPPLWEIIDDLDSSGISCNDSVRCTVKKLPISTRSTRGRRRQPTSREARPAESGSSSSASQVANELNVGLKLPKRVLHRSKSVEAINKSKPFAKPLKPCRSLTLELDANSDACDTNSSRSLIKHKPVTRSQVRNRQEKQDSMSSKESQKDDTVSLSSSSEVNKKPPVPIKPNRKVSGQSLSTLKQIGKSRPNDKIPCEDVNTPTASAVHSSPSSKLTSILDTVTNETIVKEIPSNSYTSLKPNPESPPTSNTVPSCLTDEKSIRDQDVQKKVSFLETFNSSRPTDHLTTLVNLDNNTNYSSYDDVSTKTVFDHIVNATDAGIMGASPMYDQIDSDIDSLKSKEISSGRSQVDNKQLPTTMQGFENFMKDTIRDFGPGAFTQNDDSSMTDIDEYLTLTHSSVVSSAKDKTAYDDIINILQVLEGEESSSLLCLDSILNEKPDLRSSDNMHRTQQPSARRTEAAGTNLAEIFSYLDQIDKESVAVLDKAQQSIKISHQMMKGNQNPNHGMVMSLDRGDGAGLFQNVAAEVQPVKLEELLSLGVVDLAHMVFTLRFQLEDKTKSVKLLKTALNEEREKKEDLVKDGERNLASRLREQKDQYESTIARHQKFIDQLISDKKSLTGKVEAVVSEMKTLEERHAKNVKTLQERHSVEIQRAKDMQAANNKMRMDRWVDTKTKKIKEQTVKGLEPELARMMASHAQEVNELRQLHQHELREVELRAARKTEQAMEQLRQQLHQENHEALAKERDAFKVRVEKAVEQEEMLYQEHRHRLLNEVKREKQRLEEQLTESKRDNAKAIERVRQEHQDALEGANRRHATDLRNLREEMEAQRETWVHSYKKQKESELHSREQELWEELKKERDRQIDMVVAQLAEETEQAKKEMTQGVERKIRKLTEKFEADLRDLEMSEQTAKAKFGEAKSKVISLEDSITELRASLRQLDKELQEERKISEMLSSERSQNKEVVRQEFIGKMTALEQELQNIRTELATSKTKYEVELGTLRTVKEREMQAVYSRVKTTVAQRDITIEELTGKCRHLEELVEAQRKEYLLK